MPVQCWIQPKCKGKMWHYSSDHYSSVILKNKDLCQLLVNTRASVRGPLFTNVPSPIAIARKMDLPEISDILDPTESDEEDNELQ